MLNCLFFPARPRSCYSFFFMSSKLYCVEKMENWVWKRCACTGSRGTIFFPLSWHLVQQMGILQAKHWKMGSPHCALPHCASLLESAWSPRQIYIVVAPPVMPLPPQTGAVPVYRDTPGLIKVSQDRSRRFRDAAEPPRGAPVNWSATSLWGEERCQGTITEDAQRKATQGKHDGET